MPPVWKQLNNVEDVGFISYENWFMVTHQLIHNEIQFHENGLLRLNKMFFMSHSNSCQFLSDFLMLSISQYKKLVTSLYSVTYSNDVKISP